MARRATNPDGSKVERRKSHRFPVAVPVEVRWRGPDGAVLKEDGVARHVNAQGGHLEMGVYPEIGSRVTLTNFLSAETAEARVLATPDTRAGVMRGIIAELVAPSESFWGVNLQVKKTSAELQKLENSLRLEGIDFRMLGEFREAIEYVRTSAAVVQQLRTQRLQGREDDEIMDLLVRERIRRATHLCLEVITDLESGRVHASTPGLGDFCRSLEMASERARRLQKQQRSLGDYLTTQG